MRMKQAPKPTVDKRRTGGLYLPDTVDLSLVPETLLRVIYQSVQRQLKHLLYLGKLQGFERDLDDLLQLTVCQLAAVYLKTKQFTFTRQYCRRHIHWAQNNLYGKPDRPGRQLHARTYLVAGDVLDTMQDKSQDYRGRQARLSYQIAQQQLQHWLEDIGPQEVLDQQSSVVSKPTRTSATHAKLFCFRIPPQLKEQLTLLAATLRISISRLIEQQVTQGIVSLLQREEKIALPGKQRGEYGTKGSKKDPTVACRLSSTTLTQLTQLAGRLVDSQRPGAKSELLRLALTTGLDRLGPAELFQD
jgi:predicted HicB family RNase H-like nuclease